MLTVGDRFPSYSLRAVVSLDRVRAFTRVTDADHPGRWKVWFSWPMDFSFVCPTELAEFGRRAGDFADRDAVLFGVSTDTHHVHLAWRTFHPDLHDVPFPMVADPRRELCGALGILHREEGVALRATFLVDPAGIIRWACVHDLEVGRSVPEVLRVLDALQTGALCPCNWQPGEPTLEG
ncbi:MAG: hypothetical protein RLZZ299_3066 [Pseudomonadota bacterium]|jgi:peroxiredoxin (alkyl hydroperoxide reductase subunit C)